MKEAVDSIMYYYLVEPIPDINKFSLFFYPFLLYAIYKMNKEAVQDYDTDVTNLSLITRVNRLIGFIFKHRVKFTIGIIITIALYLKFIYLISVTEPSSDIRGVKQRAQVADKLVNYRNDMMHGTKGGRGGTIFNPLISWYEKPTSLEMAYLEEYLIKIFTIHDDLIKQGKICPVNTKYSKNRDLVAIQKEAMVVVMSVNLSIKNVDEAKFKGSQDIDAYIKKILVYYFKCH